MADTHEVLEGVKDYTLELLGTGFRDDARGSATRSEAAATRAESARDEAVTLAEGVSHAEARAGGHEDAARGHEDEARVQAETAGAHAGVAEGHAVVSQEWADSSTTSAALSLVAAATQSQLVGEGFPEGKVSARVGSTYVDRLATAGAVRWIKTTGDGNTGWEVEWGDTGERSITARIPTVTSGRVTISRINATVWMSFEDVQTAPTGTSFQQWDSLIPSGFLNGLDFAYIDLPQLAGSYASGPLRISRWGQLVVYGAGDGKNVTGTVSWHTRNPWPASLPGTPV